jgi:uncharacterized protein involved in exopolysaccharide biosynthesis
MVGWGAVALWPTKYSSSAVVYADLNELAADDDGGFDKTTGTPVGVLKDILLSDQNLTATEESVSLDAARSQTLRDDIMLRSTVPPLFVVAYEHRNPDVAHSVLTALLEGFKARLDETTTSSLTEARELDQQIADHERRLEASEDDVNDYKRDNADQLDGAEGRIARLALLEQEAESLAERVDQATAERDRLAEALAEAPPVETVDADVEEAPPLEELESERLALQAELAKLRERYADSHPYVSGVLNGLQDVDARIEAASAAPPADELALADGAEAERGALEQQHGELIADVSTLSSRLRAKRREIDLLQALTKTTTSVESELTELLAVKDDLAAALETLRQQRQELGNVEGGKAKQEAFRLINQPELPTDPIGPSRLLALTVILFGGVSVGGVAALSWNRYKGVFESAWQLKQRFDVGVLGTISEAMTPAERKQLGHSKLAFGLACVALFGAFGGLVFAELRDMLIPLGDHIRSQVLG